MPIYEYYCDSCDRVFESLRSIRDSELPAACPTCGREADRIMPTTFAPRSFREGWAQRVPYHHHSVRGEKPQRTIARVRAKPSGGRARTKPKKGS
jgi:putative FmdB family regulatory protein